MIDVCVDVIVGASNLAINCVLLREFDGLYIGASVVTTFKIYIGELVALVNERVGTCTRAVLSTGISDGNNDNENTIIVLWLRPIKYKFISNKRIKIYAIKSVTKLPIHGTNCSYFANFV